MTQTLKTIADQQGIPLRTLGDVQAALEAAKKTNADAAMAKIMLRHGRLTGEARTYVWQYLEGQA